MWLGTAEGLLMNTIDLGDGALLLFQFSLAVTV